MRERRAVTQLTARGRPTAAGRDHARAIPSSKRLLDRCLVGRWVGPAGEADRAEATAASRRDRAGGGIELAIVAGLDPVGEEVEHRLLVDRRSGQDARARRMTGDFADREPLAAGERRGRSRAESRGRRPIASFRRLDPRRRETRSGKASARARARSCSSTSRLLDASRRRQPAASFRAASARGRPVRAPAPPAQLQIWVVAAQPALGEKHGDIGRRRAETRARGHRAACARAAAPAAARRWRGRGR